MIGRFGEGFLGLKLRKSVRSCELLEWRFLGCKKGIYLEMCGPVEQDVF